MFSQTGAELFAWDQFSEKDPRSLLEVMSDPSEFSTHIQLVVAIQDWLRRNI